MNSAESGFTGLGMRAMMESRSSDGMAVPASCTPTAEIGSERGFDDNADAIALRRLK
ncbi:MAG: hypothetical protein IPH52_27550 [Leptospiraceae bacterium]|nr:hypothetical protein [Leptospiraceae bacterium]